MGAERRPGQEAHQQFKAGLPGINGVVGRSEERAVGALAQRFTYHTVEEIPAGVNPLQWDFLREAWLSGAYKKLKPKTAEMIDRYYHTEDTQADIAKDYNVTQGAVWERITRGMAKMRRVMYRNNPTLAQEDPYPLAQVQKGKEKGEVARTAKSKQKRREAGRRGGRPVKVDVVVAKPTPSE